MQELLEKRREPAIWYHTVENAVSKSRSGGLPSLPEGVDWPVSLETKVPLHFLAQIDLAALPATPLPGCPFEATLPRQGMLFFFYSLCEYAPEGEVEGTKSAGNNSRVIYTPAAGADRAAPKTLPMIGHEPGKLGGRNAKDSNVLPTAHLQAYAIDTFWVPGYFGDGGAYVEDIPYKEHFGAKFQSIVDATGVTAPVYHWEAVPSPPPSHYIQTPDSGDPQKILSGLQMFGAETQWVANGKQPRNKSRVVLLECPLYAHEAGSLQFWIKTKDLNAQNFKRTGASAHFS